SVDVRDSLNGKVAFSCMNWPEISVPLSESAPLNAILFCLASAENEMDLLCAAISESGAVIPFSSRSVPDQLSPVFWNRTAISNCRPGGFIVPYHMPSNVGACPRRVTATNRQANALLVREITYSSNRTGQGTGKLEIGRKPISDPKSEILNRTVSRFCSCS